MSWSPHWRNLFLFIPVIALWVVVALHVAGNRASAAGVTAVTAGDIHTCVLLADGSVKCWGSNLYGQLGTGDQRYDHDTPTSVSSLQHNVIQVDAGDTHTCAVTAGGAAMCWGDNYQGKLGDGTTELHDEPVAVSGLDEGVVTVDAGGDHTCAITSDGVVLCWGWSHSGQVGDGEEGLLNAELTPFTVDLGGPAVSVAAGAAHTCAVMENGSVWCWGSNYYGQLGASSSDTCGELYVMSPCSLSPIEVVGVTTAVAVTAGEFHSCALLASGAINCWGQGALGNGISSINTSPPVEVLGIDNAVTISAARWHTCAGTTDGAYCWGSIPLGDGGTCGLICLAPVRSPGIEGLVPSVAAGENHSCAVRQDAGLLCWGSNGGGQLGTGDDIWYATPMSPAPLKPTPCPTSGCAAATATPSPTPTPQPTPTPRIGDVNCDRTSNSLDAILVLQYDARLVQELACSAGADVNGDRRINSLDASLILQREAGLG